MADVPMHQLWGTPVLPCFRRERMDKRYHHPQSSGAGRVSPMQAGDAVGRGGQAILRSVTRAPIIARPRQQ